MEGQPTAYTPFLAMYARPREAQYGGDYSIGGQDRRRRLSQPYCCTGRAARRLVF